MFDIYLIVHFIGLSIGAGTSVYIAAMGAQAAKSGDPQVIKQTMVGPGSAVAMVGSVGLVLLIISGILLVVSVDYGAQLGGLFIAKMVLVVLIVIFVGSMKMLVKKARQEEGMQTLARMKKLGPIGLLLGMATIVLAVLVFH